MTTDVDLRSDELIGQKVNRPLHLTHVSFKRRQIDDLWKASASAATIYRVGSRSRRLSFAVQSQHDRRSKCLPLTINTVERTGYLG